MAMLIDMWNCNEHSGGIQVGVVEKHGRKDQMTCTIEHIGLE